MPLPLLLMTFLFTLPKPNPGDTGKLLFLATIKLPEPLPLLLITFLLCWAEAVEVLAPRPISAAAAIMNLRTLQFSNEEFRIDRLFRVRGSARRFSSANHFRFSNGADCEVCASLEKSGEPGKCKAKCACAANDPGTLCPGCIRPVEPSPPA